MNRTRRAVIGRVQGSGRLVGRVSIPRIPPQVISTPTETCRSTTNSCGYLTPFDLNFRSSLERGACHERPTAPGHKTT